MSWKPFVVGVDASPEAAAAAGFACRTAERANAGCRLVHATRDMLAGFEAPQVEVYRQAIVEQARGQIAAVVSGKVPAGTRDEMMVRFGSAAGVLKDVVAEIGEKAAAALKFQTLLVYGKAEAIARERGIILADTKFEFGKLKDGVQILVTAGTPTTIRRVLVAVDLSGAARRTLRVAERYAALFGAELRALSVFEPLPVIPEVTPSYDPTEYYAMSEELLHRDIWPAIRMKGVEKVVRYGTAVDTILRETAAWQTDLLVVGSHGKGWATRVLVGSVTERLLNHLPTSLIVVPVSAAQVAEPVGVKLATAMA